MTARERGGKEGRGTKEGMLRVHSTHLQQVG